MWFYLLGARFCFCYFLNHKLNAKDELSSQTAARTKNRYFFFVWRYLKVQTTTFNLVINCKENHNLNWSFHLNWHSCWPATWSHIMNTIHWMRFRQKMFLFYRECVIIWFNVSEREKNVFLQKKYRELNLSQDLSKYVESWSIEWSRIRTPMKELSGSCSQTCEIFDCHGSSKMSRVFFSSFIWCSSSKVILMNFKWVFENGLKKILPKWNAMMPTTSIETKKLLGLNSDKWAYYDCVEFFVHCSVYFLSTLSRLKGCCWSCPLTC